MNQKVLGGLTLMVCVVAATHAWGPTKVNASEPSDAADSAAAGAAANGAGPARSVESETDVAITGGDATAGVVREGDGNRAEAGRDDAGRDDAGREDAGGEDAGREDAGGEEAGGRAGSSAGGRAARASGPDRAASPPEVGERALVRNSAAMSGTRRARAPACADAAELQVLQALRERRLELERRERVVRAREAVVEKLEKTLGDRMDAVFAELRVVEDRLRLGDAARGDHDKRIESLVTAVKALSPRKAAPMVANTQQELAVKLLIRLGPEHAASLLGAMDPQAAAQLMEAMATASGTNTDGGADADAGAAVATGGRR